jgi:APA family basic amino acid/polyamine antiporter
VVGTIIGSSIFVQASEIANLVPHPTAILLAWAVAGLLTLIGALVCAELASAYPRTGGVYVFLKEIYSPSLGFLWGWAMLWTMHSGILAAIATVFARYAGFFVPLSDVTTRVAAVLAIVVLSAINYLGVKFGSRVQSAFTLVKVLAVFAIIILGFVLYEPTDPDPSLQFEAAAFGAANFFLAVGAGLFAFGGWHMVTYTAEETVNPTTTIPRSLMIGIAIVTACYIGLNLVYTLNLPMKAVMTSTRIAADTFAVLIGPQAAGVISALVMFSAFGALNGIVMVGPRVYYQMSQDGLWFRWAAHLHPAFQTPDRAIILQALVSSVLVATGSYRALFTRVIYTEWLFFALMALGLVLARRNPAYQPRYRVWGYPLLPVLFFLASLAVVVNQIISDPANSAWGLLMVLAGWPIYQFFLKPRTGAESAHH